jgi:putative hemolysin
VNDLWVNLLVVLVFILIGGFFAAAEIALVSLRESQVQRLAVRGRRGRVLQKLVGDPNRFLAAVQVGVTLAGFISAGFGAAQIAPSLAEPLMSWGLNENAANIVAFVAVTVAIAYVSLVLGELVPKRIALQKAESVALFVATPINFTARITRPFIVALGVSTNAIVRLFGIDPTQARDQISGEELRDLVAAHEELTPQEREMIDDIFTAGERELREIMMPRTEVSFLDSHTTIQAATKIVIDQPHSRYPVIRGSADDVIGFVHIRDILDPAHQASDLTVGRIARHVQMFPGSKGVISTLNEMRRLRAHLAIVQDEYGGTAGLVTMEDLVEELIGDIKDEYDAETPILNFEVAGEISVDGLLNRDDFADDTGIELPDGPFETVAGFIVAELGRLPELDDIVMLDNHELHVKELDGRRVSRVVVVTHEVPQEEEVNVD